MELAMAPKERLKISELARRAGVSRGTIQHYLREGLLPKPVKTHRNMAYYDPACVERIQVIKELQSRGHLPLAEIRQLLSSGRGKTGLATALVGMQRSALAALAPLLPSGALTETEAAKAFDLPPRLISDLVKLDLVQPTEQDGRVAFRGSSLEILAAVSNLKRLGFTEDVGFEAKDLLIYKDALQSLFNDELRTFLGRIVKDQPLEDLPRLAQNAIDGATMLLLALRKKLIVDLLESASPEILTALAGGIASANDD